MSNVSIRNVSKNYPNGRKAVKNLSLDIADGEFVVLTGPARCGKSSILRMLAGLEDISAGEIFLDGKRINDIDPKERDLALISKNSAIYPQMTVYENLAYGLKLRKLPMEEIDCRIQEIARVLQMEDLLKRESKFLSEDQKQLTVLGRALVRKPKVLLLDEPLWNLDANLRDDVCVRLSKLQKKLGMTFIYVTEDPLQALLLGQRIVVLKDGEVIQTDTPTNLREKPKNQFIAGFFCVPRMNFADAVLKKEGEETYLTFGQSRLMVPSEKAGKLVDYLGKEIIFGICPDQISDKGKYTAVETKNLVPASVETLKIMGPDVYLFASCEGTEFIVKEDPDTCIKTGDEIGLSFDVNEIFIFDKSTQKTICN